VELRLDGSPQVRRGECTVTHVVRNWWNKLLVQSHRKVKFHTAALSAALFVPTPPLNRERENPL